MVTFCQPTKRLEPTWMVTASGLEAGEDGIGLSLCHVREPCRHRALEDGQTSPPTSDAAPDALRSICISSCVA